RSLYVVKVYQFKISQAQAAWLFYALRNIDSFQFRFLIPFRINLVEFSIFKESNKIQEKVVFSNSIC
ncbi:hypothetical protein JWG44_09520, partial [Leptospira sp. 201903071]|uniref:hypothetical protein n=1 Tax=Leptospira ainazelensis TaxID=2810034 RepID=UPI0019631AD8